MIGAAFAVPWLVFAGCVVLLMVVASVVSARVRRRAGRT